MSYFHESSISFGKSKSKTVAIVGIAAELPSGAYSSKNLDHNSFFEFLLNRGESYSKIPSDYFNIDAWKGNGPGLICTESGSFLKDSTLFDYLEFGITAKDAQAMAVSTRKLIELSFLALLDSGIDYRSRNVGCFTSGVAFDILGVSEPDAFEARGSFAGAPAMVANKVSYHLDLLGPSIPLDTACSSSMTATHLAVQSIRSGDCEAAVVGGVQFNHRFIDWIQYSQGGVLAPDGKCKPFDASANGFSRAEAGVVIVLKPLDRAIEDGDHIYATILGTGINNSGSAAPVNAPVANSQRDAMRRAWAQTGRNPSECDYVEVHATGTAAGDPTEANWVGDAFKRDGKLIIGSVKANIGHTEIAAFLVSLMKVLGMIKTGVIPPQVNLAIQNPAIDWEKHFLLVARDVQPLPILSDSGQALISLASAGIGGANGHAVLEAPPRLSHHEISSAPPGATLFVAGGLSPRSGDAVADSITELALTNASQLPLISAVFGRRSRQMTWRSFAIVEPNTSAQFSQPALVPRIKPHIVFVFGGQGPQHVAMGKQLFQKFPIFRQSVLEMDADFLQITGYSLVGDVGLFDVHANSTPYDLFDIWPIAVTLPALAILQCALFDLLSSVGVRPDILLGHSAGEVPLLYASGAASRSMAVELAIARGIAMTITESMGATMAALACSISIAQVVIDETLEDGNGGNVEIACHNAPDAVTISGPTPAVDRVVAAAKARGFLASKLRTRVPAHSALMDSCKKEYQVAVEALWLKYPGSNESRIPTYSTVTGEPFSGPFTAKYFWDGARNPVLFTEAISHLISEHPTATFIEISPHPVLSLYLSSSGAKTVLCPLRRPKRNERVFSEDASFLDALGHLAIAGHNCIDFMKLNGDPDLDSAIRLTNYPLVPRHVPYRTKPPSFQELLRPRIGPLNDLRLRINAKTHPILAEHIIKGEPIMPAAGYLECALEFGARTLWDVEFRSMLSLSGEQPTTVEVLLDGWYWTVKTSSSFSSGHVKDKWKNTPHFDRLHAEGYLSFDTPDLSDLDLDVDTIRNRCQPMSLDGFYESLKTFADYGPSFQRITEIYLGTDEVLVKVAGAASNLNTADYRFHPAILDSCLHAMVHKAFTLDTDPAIYYLPSKVGRMAVTDALLNRPFPPFLYAHCVLQRWTPDGIVANVTISDFNGDVLCCLDDVEVAKHESIPILPTARRYDVVWQDVDIPYTPNTEHDVQIQTLDLRSLYTVLDQKAITAITQTLQQRPVVGVEPDRKRYFEFLLAASECSVDFEISEDSFRASWEPFFEVTDRVKAAHMKIIYSSKAAVEALYMDNVMTRLYDHFDYSVKANVDRFHNIVNRIVETTGKKVIKVLEVGAGTGALTRGLSAAILEMPNVAIELVVTDISRDLLPRIPYPHVRYRVYDLRRDPEEQGIDPGFDVICAFEVLHAIHATAPVLANLNRLLVSGGFLLVGESNGAAWVNRSAGSIWYDFIFGSFSEWFGSSDGRQHCAMTVNSWRHHLHDLGFGNVNTVGYTGDPFHFILEAQKTGFIPRNVLRSFAMPIMFHYRRGAELELRDTLLSQDSSSSVSLWITAMFGIDGDAAMGLSRSLAKEYEFWNVHLVIFRKCQPRDHLEQVVLRLARMPSSDMVMVLDDDGKVSVPRVVPSNAPSKLCSFDPEMPWAILSSGVSQVAMLGPQDEFVTVNVEAVSHATESVKGYVGRVLDSPSTKFRKDDIVIGVSSELADVSNFINVHSGTLAKLPRAVDTRQAAASALGLTIAALALRAWTTRPQGPRNQFPRRILVSHTDTDVGQSLIWFLNELGLPTDSHLPPLQAYDVAALRRQKVSPELVLIACHSRAEYDSFLRIVSPSGKVFSWNGPVNDVLAVLVEDPYAVGEALEKALERLGCRFPPVQSGVYPSEFLNCALGQPVPYLGPLFDHRKAYILVGGVGGIGLCVALFMVKNGARYIVLTSHSGRASLSRSRDALPLRILQYLETLSDLTLRVEASDATSHDECRTLLKSIPRVIGGCMLMTVVLEDKLFSVQTSDGFRNVWASKVDAFTTLADTMDISLLDFFIAFSSMVGLVGNIGQTNYTSANTALDGLVRKYDNAFAFICPAVTDGGGIASETGEHRGRIGHLSRWGMTSREICNSIEDAILKLKDGPFWQYIPDLKWDIVESSVGMSSLFSHLVESDIKQSSQQKDADKGETMLNAITTLLDVPVEEFSPDVPFTAYGLDSISAAKMSFFLEPFVVVSQLQLLSDMTFHDLAKRLGDREEASESHNTKNFPTGGLSSSGTNAADAGTLFCRFTKQMCV